MREYLKSTNWLWHKPDVMWVGAWVIKQCQSQHVINWCIHTWVMVPLNCPPVWDNIETPYVVIQVIKPDTLYLSMCSSPRVVDWQSVMTTETVFQQLLHYYNKIPVSDFLCYLYQQPMYYGCVFYTWSLGSCSKIPMFYIVKRSLLLKIKDQKHILLLLVR